ncbi:50S ribosomal protein L24 [Thermodesulfovibrionales bacterium]|nr:50S ribosomal protein L24 [Thermodesulfovibrionales bacterium]MCL0049805.1 50S ribosomal protein L24 [Thermodesulfovibrionales bacterium]MCL0083793.1 50S ribosomal protein L24 [Thermodesulfovibrionales bacterium]MCL0096800.1 50S ribosomal protein L24 [Thermodesulfovibrionales bacterium]
MGLRIKKDDIVIALIGKNSGKSGKVLSVLPVKEKVIIEGLNMVKKHIKPNRQQKQGGIIDKEAPIHISNVMLICPKCNKPTRIGTVVLGDEKKFRKCKRCKEVIS